MHVLVVPFNSLLLSFCCVFCGGDRFDSLYITLVLKSSGLVWKTEGAQPDSEVAGRPWKDGG